MSTPTCSTFLPRSCLSSYMSGKYLLAANGSTVELFDMEAVRSGKFSALTDVPIKTLVTKYSTIYHILPLERSGHLVVITSETRSKCRILCAHLIHRDTLESGGYAMDSCSTYVLSREENLVGSDTRAEVIPGKDEFVLATSTFIARFRFSFPLTHDKLEAEIFEEEHFDFREIISHQLERGLIVSPCYISPSTPLNVMLRAINSDDSQHSDDTLLFLHTADPSLTCREFLTDDVPRVQIILPCMRIGIICGDKYISIVSTSANQSRVDGSRLTELARIVNPFPSSPQSIVAKEDKDSKSAIIVIISAQKVSTWKLTDGNLLQLSDTDDAFLTGQESVHEILLNKSNVDGLQQPANYNSKDSLKYLDRFVDATIINDSTAGLDTCNLVISRLSGTLVACNVLDVPTTPTLVMSISMPGCHIPVEAIVPLWNFEASDVSSLTMLASSEGSLAFVNLAGGDTQVGVLSPPNKNGRAISNVSEDCETISICFSPKQFALYRSSCTQFPIFASKLHLEIYNCLISDRFVAFIAESRADVLNVEDARSDKPIEQILIGIQLSHLAKGERITAFLFHRFSDGSPPLGIFGTTTGRIFAAPVVDGSSPHFDTIRTFLNEEVIDIKRNWKLKKLMAIGKNGQIALFSMEDLLEGTNHQSEQFHLKKANNSVVLGFMTLMATRREDREEIIVVKDEEGISLYELPFLQQLFKISLTETVHPNTSFFAHYVGDVKNSRIRMYIHTGTCLPTKILQVDGQMMARINVLTRNSNVNSHLHEFSDRSRNVYMLGNDYSADVISIGMMTVEYMKMNRKGRLSRISSGEVIGTGLENLRISCSDAKFKPDFVYILVGEEAGKVHFRKLNKLMIPKFEYALHTEVSKILSVRFFQDHSISSDVHNFAVLAISRIQVYKVDLREQKNEVRKVHELTSDTIDLKDCSMLTMGDGEMFHDVWLISNEKVNLFIGRNQKYRKKTVELRLDDWKGKVTAICGMSTKKNEQSGRISGDYFDIVTVAKMDKIRLLVAMHMDEDPANGIQFVEWKIAGGSRVVGVHTELLKYEVENDIHTIDVRMYVMKRKGSLHISVGRLVVEGSGVTLTKALLNMCKIPTSVCNPHQIVVSNMPRLESKSNREPPKFVLVSGSNGSQVIRICPKKQLYSHSLDNPLLHSAIDSALNSDEGG